MEGKVISIKRPATTLLGLTLMLSMTAVAQSTSATGEQAKWHGTPAADRAVLYGFASISDLPTLAEGPVKETCSDYPVPPASTSGSKTRQLTEDEAVKLAEGVDKELEKELAKKMSVSVAQPGNPPAAGSLVFTGCFVGADSGSAGKRLIGMGLGASHLLAHVRVFYVGTSGPVPVDEFDLAVKGSNKLPPLGAAGLAVNAISDKGKSLQGDSKRMADEILKKLKKDHLV
jgi:hypothetical protein